MWAGLVGSQVSPWLVLCVIRVCFCAFRFPKALASGYAVQLPVYKCPYPDSPDPEQHEKFINGLNGTKIVFIGDSITRCCACLAACRTICTDTVRLPTPSTLPWSMLLMYIYAEWCACRAVCHQPLCHVPGGRMQVPVHDVRELHRTRRVSTHWWQGNRK